MKKFLSSTHEDSPNNVGAVELRYKYSRNAHLNLDISCKKVTSFRTERSDGDCGGTIYTGMEPPDRDEFFDADGDIDCVRKASRNKK
jgi:hypothetical protein